MRGAIKHSIHATITASTPVHLLLFYCVYIPRAKFTPEWNATTKGTLCMTDRIAPVYDYSPPALENLLRPAPALLPRSERILAHRRPAEIPRVVRNIHRKNKVATKATTNKTPHSGVWGVRLWLWLWVEAGYMTVIPIQKCSRL